MASGVVCKLGKPAGTRKATIPCCRSAPFLIRLWLAERRSCDFAGSRGGDFSWVDPRPCGSGPRRECGAVLEGERHRAIVLDATHEVVVDIERALRAAPRARPVKPLVLYIGSRVLAPVHD
ncbi:hypothetical protein FQR65_LT20474 [Abscondita terminalis]|nr:hypothetical protein FQR65_LT20474 [Abscondita terminalis]